MLTPGLNNNEKFPVYFYEWQAWSKFLFKYLSDSVIRVEAKIHQSNESILEQVTTGNGYFLFHLNLTQTEYFFNDKEGLLNSVKNKGLIAINANVINTSKRHLQGVLKQLELNTTWAGIDGDSNELLMVKTNFNYGGKFEKYLTKEEFRLLHLSRDMYEADNIYSVIKRKKIKNRVWRNKNLVVEKYISNSQDYFYRVYKLLNRIVVSEVRDTLLIKKLDIGIKRTNYFYDLNTYDPNNDDSKYKELVTAILRLTTALNVDFGAIDVVRSEDNSYYIIDVNLTPFWGRDDEKELLNYLSEGLKNNYQERSSSAVSESRA